MNRKRIIAAGGLVFNENNELLMILRRGYWDLPKGKLDKGETVESCAIREVQEETGLKNIVLGKFITITLHEYFDTYLDEDVVKESHWYHMKVQGPQELIPQTEEDIMMIKWVKRESLPEYLNNTYPNIIEVIRIFYSTQQP
ncbi:MAG TPA: NUDIX domain-containing protein [Sediminibacterium sp.]|nr:NUDIX domain-containing protein [Sediminibacterium sp.]